MTRSHRLLSSLNARRAATQSRAQIEAKYRRRAARYGLDAVRAIAEGRIFFAIVSARSAATAALAVIGRRWEE